MKILYPQDPGSSEIQSPLIAGISEILSKLCDILRLETTTITDAVLYPIIIDNQEENHNRIYEDIHNRLWIPNPSPIFKKNGNVINPSENNFSIDYIGGSITFQDFDKPTDDDVITVSATCISNSSEKLDSVISQLEAVTRSSARYKGSFESLEDLIIEYPNAQKGDYAIVLSFPAVFVWDNTQWKNTQSIEDLSGYYTKIETNKLLEDKEDTIESQGTTSASDNYYWGGRKTWLDFRSKVRGTQLTNLNLGMDDPTPIQSSDILITALGKLQAQISKDQENLYLKGNSEPTNTTEGNIGQRYIDISNGSEYMCYGVDSNGKYIWKQQFDHEGLAKNSAALGGTPAAAVLHYSYPTVYVSETGNDTTGTGSSSNPWRTIQKAVNAVRPYNGKITISVAAGNYPERVTLQYVNCTLYITGKSTGHAVLRGITATNCQNLVLQYLDFTETDAAVETDLLQVTNCKSVQLKDGTLTGNQKQRGLRIETSRLYAARLQINHCLTACYAIYQSDLRGSDLTGTGNSTAVYSSLSTVSLMRSSISASTPVSTVNNGTVTIDGAAYNAPATSLGGYEAGHYLNRLYQTGEGAPAASTAGNAGQRYVDAVTLDSYISQGGTAGNYKWAKLANANRLPNRNLLDNWYFPDPINQRWNQVYSAQGYTIDRWYLVNGSASLTSSGITLQKSSDKTYIEFHIRIKGLDLSSTYTISGIVDGELKSASGKISDIQHALAARGWGGDALNRIEGYLNTTLNCVIVRFIFVSETAHVIQAAKLELGEQQTLAHPDASGNWILNDPPPNKALELAKCHRYYQRHNLNAYLYASGVSGIYELSIQYPEMRANPAVSFVAGSTGLNAELVSTTAFVARSNQSGSYVGGVVLDAEL